MASSCGPTWLKSTASQTASARRLALWSGGAGGASHGRPYASASCARLACTFRWGGPRLAEKRAVLPVSAGTEPHHHTAPVTATDLGRGTLLAKAASRAANVMTQRFALTLMAAPRVRISSSAARLAAASALGGGDAAAGGVLSRADGAAAPAGATASVTKQLHRGLLLCVLPDGGGMHRARDS